MEERLLNDLRHIGGEVIGFFTVLGELQSRFAALKECAGQEECSQEIVREIDLIFWKVSEGFVVSDLQGRLRAEELLKRTGSSQGVITLEAIQKVMNVFMEQLEEQQGEIELLHSKGKGLRATINEMAFSLEKSEKDIAECTGRIKALTKENTQLTAKVKELKHANLNPKAPTHPAQLVYRQQTTPVATEPSQGPTLALLTLEVASLNNDVTHKATYTAQLESQLDCYKSQNTALSLSVVQLKNKSRQLKHELKLSRPNYSEETVICSENSLASELRLLDENSQHCTDHEAQLSLKDKEIRAINRRLRFYQDESRMYKAQVENFIKKKSFWKRIFGK